MSTESFYKGFGSYNSESNILKFYASKSDEQESYVYSNGKLLKNELYCMNPNSEVPPIIDIRKLMEKMQLVNYNSQTFDDRVNRFTERNENEENFSVFRVKYSGMYYVIILDGEMKLKKIISKNFELTIDDEEEEDVVMMGEKLYELESVVESCEVSRKVYDDEGESIEWFNDPHSCNLEWISGRDDNNINSNGKCESLKRNGITIEQKDCIFLHGVGITESQAGPPLSSWPYYWGHLDQHVRAQCKNMSFLRVETEVRGWDNLDLQKSVCDYMKDEDNVIRDKLLYVHSMGNLIMGGILRNGYCSFDETTSKWFNMAGTQKGSEAADWIIKLCQDPHKTNLIKDLASFFGYCLKNDTAHHSYYSLSPEYPPLEGLFEIIDNYTNGRMCGDDPWGISSKYSAYFAAVGELAFKKGQTNDGMVNMGSCRSNEGVEYYRDFHEDFYLAHINHVDATCRNNDGYWGIDRQPLSYVSSKY